MLSSSFWVLVSSCLYFAAALADKLTEMLGVTLSMSHLAFRAGRPLGWAPTSEEKFVADVAGEVAVLFLRSALESFRLIWRNIKTYKMFACHVD